MRNTYVAVYVDDLGDAHSLELEAMSSYDAHCRVEEDKGGEGPIEIVEMYGPYERVEEEAI